MGLFDRRPRRTVGIQLPTYRAPEAGLEVIDRKRVTLRATADASGTATATGPDIPSRQRWVLEQATIACTSTSATKLRLFDGAASPANQLDGSNAGNYDNADWSPGLIVSAGSRLVAQWTGATTGAVATMNVQVQVLQDGSVG